MSRDTSGNKARPARRGHLSAVPDSDVIPDVMPSDLLQELRRGLRADGPLDLLAWVSGMVEVTEGAPGGAAVQLADFVESLIGVEVAETTAALRVIRAFTRDDDLRARISRALMRRRHPMPTWLAHLEDVQVRDVLRIHDVLGDGENEAVGLRFEGGYDVSLIAFIDHNLGSVVKDAFVVPEQLETIEEYFRSQREPGMRLDRPDPAWLRATVTAALDRGARNHPELSSDSWPMARPLLRWVLSLLPDGGSPTSAPAEASDLDWLASDIVADSDGELDAARHTALVRLALTFATLQEAGGDPLRWSAVSLRTFLLDYVPERLRVAPEGLPEHLEELPKVLEGVVVYAHDARGVGATLTHETLRALDEIGQSFLAGLTGRPQDAPDVALLMQVLGLDSPEELAQFTAEQLQGLLAEVLSGGLDPVEEALTGLAEGLGGQEQLAEMDATPLPDEPFDWSGLADDIHETVATWLDWCDRCADDLFDTELRTVFRRFLARAAAADPGIFRRRASPVRGAAALVWAAARANGAVGWGSDLTAKELLEWFGLKGSVSQRAEPLLRAISVPWEYQEHTLGTPDLLTSARRAQLVEARDYWYSSDV